MSKKPFEHAPVTVRLDKIVGGGQAIGTMTEGADDGRKVFVWGGLPGELVEVRLTKKRSKLAEGVVTQVFEPSEERIEPKDPESYLSTSPWQMMGFKNEQHYKSALIEEAFELHDIVLPETIEIYSDNKEYGYRNKVEFSFFWDKEEEKLDLAFFRRGTHGKIQIEGTSLAHDSINKAGLALRDVLRKRDANAYDLKTALIRCSQKGEVIIQLYVKDEKFVELTAAELKAIPMVGFELIFSNPKSPASVITKRLQQWGEERLTDTILDVPFAYATEGFFQINLPVYEQALNDIKKWVKDGPLVDLYSGVGTIGLTVTDNDVTLVEINESAVNEMKRNIKGMGREKHAHAVLAASENATEYITAESQLIVDPPRAGLHQDVIDQLLEAMPERIIYLSCNPVTQARDVALLAEKYGIEWHRGYNFFPRTPHIEHLLILRKK